MLEGHSLTSIKDKVRSFIQNKIDGEQAAQSTVQPLSKVESQEDKLGRFGSTPANASNAGIDITFMDDRSLATRAKGKSGRAYNDKQTELMHKLFRGLIKSQCSHGRKTNSPGHRR